MKKYDCVIIGGGHSGVEAALAASRMGCATLMVTMKLDTIGQMSCNPAIGGVGKGQLVKEIDAMGGIMGLAADATGIQFRQLNTSKGQAVRSSRCQSDRKLYKLYIQNVIKNQVNLDTLEDKVAELVVKGGKIVGVVTEGGIKVECPTVVITAGTFLYGRMHMGKTIIAGGRVNDENSVRLADNIKDLGFEIVTFKTGTPPRLDGKTINFSQLTPQYSDEKPLPFSFWNTEIPADQKLLPCHITHTNEQTHDIIHANMHLSPMYSGQIDATGVRYCPSIEDKLKKFSNRKGHHVFLEPEGLDTDEYYPNGISTGLPADVQEAFVRTIPGLENVKITQAGYSIEHGVIPPKALKLSLETKLVGGLFLAGQINGTTGYEEAAAQGLVAGVNAALYIKDKDPFILGRDESYIGVLLDDLTTKGTEEPYRMFTSRVEYRLIVREDNADKRLSKYGYDFGMLTEAQKQKVDDKYALIEEKMKYLRSTKVKPEPNINQLLVEKGSTPLRQWTLMSDLLKRPEADYHFLEAYDQGLGKVSDTIKEQVEYEIKYEGFVDRQIKNIHRFRHIENIKLPEGINYDTIPGISIEIREKLRRFAPANLGQANRISGVTPAAISILMIYLKKYTANQSV